MIIDLRTTYFIPDCGEHDVTPSRTQQPFRQRTSFPILLCSIAVSLMVCGCGSSGSSGTNATSNEAAGEKTPVAKTKVVYACKNIEEGEFMPAEALEEREIEENKAPIDAFNSVNAVVGQQAAYSIPAGQIVSQHSVKISGGGSGLEDKLKDNMRALTFGVDTYSDTAGFIGPESHVDIFSIADTKDRKVTPLLSDVEVLAVGATYQRAPGETCANPAGTVTVAVNPTDSEKLLKSLANSRPFLVLRPEPPKKEDEEQTENETDSAESTNSKQDK